MLNTNEEILPDPDPLPQTDGIDTVYAEEAQSDGNDTTSTEETQTDGFDTTSTEGTQPIDIEEDKKTRKSFSMISAFLLILTLILCFTAITFSIIFRVQEHHIEENLNPQDYVTLAEYNKIKLGMTYDQVKEIIGTDGQLKFRTNYNGSKAEFYEWFGKNKSDSKVDLIFENEIVTDKKQFGLK